MSSNSSLGTYEMHTIFEKDVDKRKVIKPTAIFYYKIKSDL